MLKNDPVAIVGVCIPKVARYIPDETTMSLVVKAVKGALADAGITKDEVNGACMAVPGTSTDWAGMFGHRLNWVVDGGLDAVGVRAVLNAAAAIQAGLCEVVVVAGGSAGGERPSGPLGSGDGETAAEFTAPFGQFPMAGFALMAQYHMHKFGTRPEHLAEAAATIRNHGHVNPEATMYGRGPYTIQDVLDSRWICEPLHLLDCCLRGQGAGALVITSGSRARQMRKDPVSILAGGAEFHYKPWSYPPRYDEIGRLGERRAKMAFEQAGITHKDVSLLSIYDPTSFEVIHQLELLGFCKEGEGGPFVEDGALSINGRLPTNPDGGLLAHAWTGTGQLTMKVIEGVRQLRGDCGARQVKNAKIAVCSNAGSSSCHWEMLILGKG
jgi:acetyl-CoA acetyltransferase